MGFAAVLAFAFAMCAPQLAALELREIEMQAFLPEDGPGPKSIGTFSLKGPHGPVTVKLYYTDTDTDSERRIYPNFFHVHCTYTAGDGAWKDEQLYRCTRVHFCGVQRSTPECVILKLVPNFPFLTSWQGEDSHLRLRGVKGVERINTSFTVTLTLVKGVPTLQESSRTSSQPGQ
jgi:hypothetical protein